MTTVVDFEKIEVVPPHTDVYQVDNGTIFYFQRTTQRLYVKIEGEEIIANMAFLTDPTIAVFGNAVYIETGRKVYKAVLVTSLGKNKIEIEFVCELMQDAVLDSQGLCTVPLDKDSKCVYRMCDDFTTQGVIVDKEQAATAATYIQERIHNGKLYFLKRSEWSETELCIMGKKVIGVQLAMAHVTWRTYVNDWSPYLYISNGDCLYTLDMETMERLAVLDFVTATRLTIVGVFAGKITATISYGEQTHLISAQIPEGFYDIKSPAPMYNQFARPSANRMEVDDDNYKYRAIANGMEDAQIAAAIAASLNDVKDSGAMPGTSGNERVFTKEMWGTFMTKKDEDEQLAAAIAASLMDEGISKGPAKPAPLFQERRVILRRKEMPREISSNPSVLDQRIKEIAKELDKKSEEDAANSKNEEYLDQALQKFEKEFQADESESAEAKKRREYEAEMSATINDLVIKNMELTQQIEELKKKNKENDDLADVELAKLCERNSELTRKHKEHEMMNWELTNELDRNEDLNEELEAANERLTKEKEELIENNEKMEKEKTATINELVANIAKLEEEVNGMDITEETDSSSVDDEIEELKRRIESVRKQNEQMSNVLTEAADASSGEEYEIIDDVENEKNKNNAT